ncbi:MAG: hypothetical protein N2C13_05070 [Chloroflexota bacterium]
MTRTKRIGYDYFAAQFLQDYKTDDITDMVLSHLDKAQSAIESAWGYSQWDLASKVKFDELDDRTKAQISQAMDGKSAELSADNSLAELDEESKGAIINNLGRHSLTEIYRELLLHVISDLWVEYLTTIEALRVSIGLEAYAQRDPLTQYKAKATQMFQELIIDMRRGVVARMFTFKPRAQNLAVGQPVAELQASNESPTPSTSPDAPVKKGRKRKRKRKSKK